MWNEIYINYRLKNKINSLFITTLLIFSNILLICLINKEVATASFTGDDSIPPLNGDWIIDSGGNVVVNETITLNGSLIIKFGGGLIFKNVTLLMNCPVNGTYNIEIENGGMFLIFDYDDNPLTTNDSSIITSAIPNSRHRFHFYVKKGATFQMKNSKLSQCGYNLVENPTYYWMEGLCIETSNSIIENCILSENRIGLMIFHFSNNSQILNTTISNNLLGGLYIGSIASVPRSETTVTSNSARIIDKSAPPTIPLGSAG